MLKAAYVANAALSDELQGADLARRLSKIYRPTGDRPGKLVRHGTPAGTHSEIEAQFMGSQRLQAIPCAGTICGFFGNSINPKYAVKRVVGANLFALSIS